MTYNKTNSPKEKPKILYYTPGITSSQIADKLSMNRAGKYRGELMYGATLLTSFGIDVVTVKYPLKKWSSKLSRIIYALYLLWESRHFSAIYAPYLSGLEYVIKLRGLKLFPKKIFLWHHNPIDDNNLKSNKLFYRGIDVAFFFSHEILRQSSNKGINLIGKSYVLNWGPDMDFYNRIRSPYEKTTNGKILMSGQDSRDFYTLLRVCMKLPNYQFEIFVPNDEVAALFKNSGQHIQIKRVPNNIEGYYDLSICTSLASLVLILTKPVPGRRLPSGLTSICEATGLAKPCIITENPYFGENLKNAGFAKFVKIEDVHGIVSAIQEVMDDLSLRQRMSEAALQFANKYNLDDMTRQLSTIIKQTL